MAKYVPPSFNRAQVRDGLLKAMGFGEPTRTEDKVIFCFPKRAAASGAAGGDGVPFDPAERLADVGTANKVVSCAAEFIDRSEESMDGGTELKPSRLRITLLDEEYQEVKDFSYVVAGGDKYNRDFIEPPVALGSLDVWTLHLRAEDDR